MGVRGSPPDAEVVALVLAGNTEAFGIVIRRYEAGLLRFATRMRGSRDAAADAVAESFVRAYRHLASCREPTRLRTWLYRIVTNRCKSHLVRRSVADVPLDDAPPVADPADTEADLERADQLLLVERALAELSPDKREAFVLKHVEGLSYEEMATVTGERIPTLKMRVRPAWSVVFAAVVATLTLFTAGDQGPELGEHEGIAQFVGRFPEAQSVHVVGTFNDWRPGSIALEDQDHDGVWRATVVLPAGTYEYMFVVDGERWVPDHLEERLVADNFGRENSIVIVRPARR